MAALVEFTGKANGGKPIYIRKNSVTTFKEQPGGGTRISFLSVDGKELEHETVTEPLENVVRALGGSEKA